MKMTTPKALRRGVLVALAAVLALPGAAAAAAREKIDQAECMGCHTEVRDLWAGGKHEKKLSCTQCHAKLTAHLEDPLQVKPEIDLDPGACGKCHADQFETFNKVNHKKLARVEKSLLTERSPNPAWDKLMMGHGFTKEHNAPRSHAYMLIDHLVVDRAYGGRFQPKDGWKYVVARPPFKTWDLLEDAHPETSEHKSFLPESAPAANATCLQCKTSDLIKKWKYLGDADPGAKWSRGSNVVEVAKDIQHGVGCIHCHDPHGAKPRVVRDALIQALTRPEADTLWHQDPKHTEVAVVDLGIRKIGVLQKYDSKLQCGQCHVEYNCNPGYDSKTGEKIGFADGRTNHFPFKDVFQIASHYDSLGFRDFKHTLTGGLLFKAQHPETEVFWNSTHDRNGVSCQHCHMPKVKGKGGKVFTSHWQTSPRNYLKETCLSCHPKWTPEEAVAVIDSVKSHIRGKIRKAEFWLTSLIDKIVEAKKAGVEEKVIREAQEQHQKAHVLWEWWTAENSDGFHNPQQAREALTRSVEESRKGIELLTKAIQARSSTLSVTGTTSAK